MENAFAAGHKTGNSMIFSCLRRELVIVVITRHVVPAGVRTLQCTLPLIE